MRVKIGDQWFSASFCVELTAEDKQRIAAMPTDCTLYAQFEDGDDRSADEKRAWMSEGRNEGLLP